MKYLPEILHILSWPVLIFVSYLIIKKLVSAYEKKHPQNNEKYD